MTYSTHGLLGLPVIRTYGEIPRFLKENAYYIDLENRALILTVTNQRWLAIRLDFCGAILVLSVSWVGKRWFCLIYDAPQLALFVVFGVSGSSAAQVGLVLSYASTFSCSITLYNY